MRVRASGLFTHLFNVLCVHRPCNMDAIGGGDGHARGAARPPPGGPPPHQLLQDPRSPPNAAR
eukprot:4460740-Pyramimonas_sp.AAC.1